EAGRLVRQRQPHARAAAKHDPRRTCGGGPAARLARGRGRQGNGSEAMSATGGGARQGILSLAVKDKGQLYAAYMPYLKHGGIFVPTTRRYFIGDEVFVLLTLPESNERLPVAGKVVWVTPPGAQGNRTAGIGVQFADSAEGENVKGRIETLLAGQLESDKATHTM